MRGLVWDSERNRYFAPSGLNHQQARRVEFCHYNRNSSQHLSCWSIDCSKTGSIKGFYSRLSAHEAINMRRIGSSVQQRKMSDQRGGVMEALQASCYKVSHHKVSSPHVGLNPQTMVAFSDKSGRYSSVSMANKTSVQTYNLDKIASDSPEDPPAISLQGNVNCMAYCGELLVIAHGTTMSVVSCNQDNGRTDSVGLNDVALPTKVGTNPVQFCCDHHHGGLVVVGHGVGQLDIQTLNWNWTATSARFGEATCVTAVKSQNDISPFKVYLTGHRNGNVTNWDVRERQPHYGCRAVAQWRPPYSHTNSGKLDQGSHPSISARPRGCVAIKHMGWSSYLFMTRAATGEINLQDLRMSSPSQKLNSRSILQYGEAVGANAHLEVALPFATDDSWLLAATNHGVMSLYSILGSGRPLRSFSVPHHQCKPQDACGTPLLVSQPSNHFWDYAFDQELKKYNLECNASNSLQGASETPIYSPQASLKRVILQNYFSHNRACAPLPIFMSVSEGKLHYVSPGISSQE
eukprot:GHVN01059403.1.p1 GENE.GHVN01059403.1~~GHVN01059403.1.p1  ORF type:complete len:519 (+),score=29.02 GHVN01059403.1:3649-5205(+)